MPPLVMQPIAPIYTARLFTPLHEQLMALLEALALDQWTRPTIAGSWQVRDVVAHLLEVDLRRLSVGRDRHRIEPGRPIETDADLVGFLNELNAQWVTAARRFSPRVLIDLLQQSGPAMARLVAAAAPHDPAPFAVAWAGERQSENWFDIGRDYTERWHHQMQIRDAVGIPGLLGDRWLVPLLDLSVRCLPLAYHGVHPSGEVAIVLRVQGETESAWTLQHAAASDRDSEATTSPATWRLWRGQPPAATTTVRLDADTAWRMFYNGILPQAARQRAVVEGNDSLAEPLFRARSVMV